MKNTSTVFVSGTGTSKGDPTEINALGTFFSKYRSPEIFAPLLFGSVKSNIGHTESSAGVAGIIKVLLMMKHQQLVPSLHVRKDKSNVNKNIKLKENNMDVVVDVMNWTSNSDILTACVNSFGFGGSNSHAIIMSKPSLASSKACLATGVESQVVCISAIDKESLKINIQSLRTDLEHSNATLQEVSYTSMFYREHFPVRLLLHGSCKEEMFEKTHLKMQQLRGFEYSNKRNIVFVYCGVGTTWTGMCKAMMVIETFKNAVCDIDKYFEPLAGWKIADLFSKESNYDDPFINHVAIFATQVALTAVWRSWNVIPNKIIGQSVGEVAAAYASGIISMKDAVKVIYHRSRILASKTGGSMMVVGGMPVQEMNSICAQYETVSVAVYSSPKACTISGNVYSVKAIKARLEKDVENGRSYLIRELNVRCAYHSPLVNDCKQAIIDSIGTLHSNKTYDIPIISTVSGEEGSDLDYVSGVYWAKNVMEPVLLYQSVKNSVVKDALNIFIEIGPRQVLKAHLDNIIVEQNKLCLPSMNANQDESLLFLSLNDLYQTGHEINWKAFHKEKQAPVEIPKYSFQKKGRLHFGKKLKSILAGEMTQADASHMFVCRSGVQEQLQFKLSVDKAHTPFVYEHFLSDTLLVPGATYVDAAFYISLCVMNIQITEIAISIEFEKFVSPSEEGNVEIEARCEMQTEGHRIIYRHGDRQICSCFATFRNSPRKQQVNIENLRKHLSVFRSKTDTYACLQKLQFRYGPSLSLIERSWSKDKTCLVELTVPDSIKIHFTKTSIHPAVVDAIFQTFGILSENETSAVPRGAEKIVVNCQCKSKMFVYASEVYSTATKKYYNALLLSESGDVIAEVERFFTKSLSKTTKGLDTLKYRVSFTELKQKVLQSKPGTEILLYALDNSFIPSKIQSSVAKCKLVHTLSGVGLLKPLSIVLFAGKHDKIDGHVINRSVELFWLLRNQMLLLSRESISCPVSIVTEDCFGAPGRNEKEAKLFGSELWGMVRAIRYESVLSDIRLIDIQSSEKDGSLLFSVVTDPNLKHAELFITGQQTYSFSIQRHKNLSKQTVDVSLDRFRTSVLVSEDMNAVTSPHFKILPLNRELQKSNDVRVEIQTICLHNDNLFPVTDFGGKCNIWPTEKGETAKVVALEGTGCALGKEKLTGVVFCYPTRIETPFTHIPQECIVPANELPVYVNGMLSILCILFRLAKAVPISSQVIVMERAEESSVVRALIRSLLEKKGCSVSEFDSKGHSKSMLYGIKPTVMLVLNEFITEDLTEHLSIYRTIETIISLSLFLPNNASCALQLAKHNLNIMSFHCSEIFTRQFLMETVPKVVTFVQNLNSIKPLTNKKMLLWNIPYMSMSVKEQIWPLRLRDKDLFQKKSCYIVIGGLTGLGKLLSKFIAESGAGHVATISRRFPTNEQLNELLMIESETLCKMHSIRADVSVMESLIQGLNVLKKELNGIPIRGVFHGAGVLSDSLLENQTNESVQFVLSPKVQGSWNLHLCTKDLQLDFFVMHSSIVSILGNRGQSNYAAGNSFLDSLAAYRRAKGLCGQSINWGALEVGMAAENKAAKKNLKQLGHQLLTEEEIKQCFIDALLENAVQVCYANIQWDVILNELPNVCQKDKYNGLEITSSFQNRSSLKNSNQQCINIMTLAEDERREYIKALVRDTVCDVFVTNQDFLNDTTSFSSLGVDSMSAMSLVNSLYDVLKIRIPMIKVLSENACVQSIVVFCLQNIESRENGEKTGTNISSMNSILDRKISFMQKYILQEYLTQKKDHIFVDLVDIEIEGLVLTKTDWNRLFTLVLEAQPSLSVNIDVASNKAISLKHISIKNVTVEELNIDHLENDYKQLHFDPRKTLKFDLEKEIPVKFHVATGQNRSVIRLAVHKLVSDLTSIGLIAKEMRKALNVISGNAEQDSKKMYIDIGFTVKEALEPKLKTAELFWKHYLNQELKPTTICLNLHDPLLEHFRIETMALSNYRILNISRYIQKHGLTFFQMMSALYQLLLHIETTEKKVVMTTAVDMRVHVPELLSTATRCVNTVPLISVVENQHMEVSKFLDDNGAKTAEVLDNSYFPTEMILANIKNDELRRHIGRHYIVMDKIDDISDVLKSDSQYNYKIKGSWTRGRIKETVLYISYDMKMNEVLLELGYDSFICGPNGGRRMIDKICEIIDSIPNFETMPLAGLLGDNVSKHQRTNLFNTFTDSIPRQNGIDLPIENKNEDENVNNTKINLKKTHTISGDSQSQMNRKDTHFHRKPFNFEESATLGTETENNKNWALEKTDYFSGKTILLLSIN